MLEASAPRGMATSWNGVRLRFSGKEHETFESTLTEALCPSQACSVTGIAGNASATCLLLHMAFCFAARISLTGEMRSLVADSASLRGQYLHDQDEERNRQHDNAHYKHLGQHEFKHLHDMGSTVRRTTSSCTALGFIPSVPVSVDAGAAALLRWDFQLIRTPTSSRS